jgi:hypothetical protein
MLPEAFRSRTVVITALVALNLVPLVGVLGWGWQSFDLIFLYWMENVVVGAFTLARMVVRPYGHPLELVFPLFIAPFFAFHYGAFCWGHGTFVVSLFGPEGLDGFDLAPTVLQVLAAPTMLFALVALAFIQALDWIRDVRDRGFGADSVKKLMISPYRRIVVLHVTIIAAGFALAALDEPLAGLVMLVLIKTWSDIWHWRRDAEQANQAEEFVFTPEHLKQMQEKYPRPVVKVNGQEREFESFAAMKASNEFRIARALMRIIGASEELKAMSGYLEMKIEEEQRTA